MSEQGRQPPKTGEIGEHERLPTVDLRLLREEAITALYVCTLCHREHGFAVGAQFYTDLSALDGKRVLLRCPDFPDTPYGGFLARKRLQTAAQSSSLEHTFQWSHELIC